MSLALALALVAPLVSAASLEPELSVRTEARGSSVQPTGGPSADRLAGSLTPRAAATLVGAPVLVSASYSARLWSSDLVSDPAPLTDHLVEARGQLSGSERWRLQASAAALRAQTDPLTELDRSPQGSAPRQLASAEPLPYEVARASLAAERQLDLRTAVGAGAGWSVSRGADATARARLPMQRSIVADASWRRDLTSLDTLRLALSGSQSTTRLAAGDTSSGYAGANVTWTRRLSPRIEGALTAGAAVAREVSPTRTARLDVLPSAEAGFTRAPGPARLELSATVRVAPFLDRFDGTLATMTDGACRLRWLASPRTTVQGAVAGGIRTDGRTSLTAADLRLGYVVARRVTIEAGALARSQRDDRPGFASFFEAGLTAAVTVTSAAR